MAALYPDDANMYTRRPDRHIITSETYDVDSVPMGQGYNKEILRSRRPYREYKLVYKNISARRKNLIRDFYRARSGTFETFTLDLDHITEIGTTLVKFKGKLNIEVIGLGDYYTVSFELREVNN